MLERTTCRTLEEYRIARNEAKNMCCRKKKLLQRNILQDLHDKFRGNKTKKYYDSIRNIKHRFQPRTNTCQDNLGNLVAEDAEVLNRWNSNVIRNLEASGNIYYSPELEITEDGV
jgi:hypothetical protein